MRAPSGYIFDNNELTIIEAMHRHVFLRYDVNSFLLTSQVRSNFYVGGREDVTDNPLFERMLGTKVASLIKQYTRGTGNLAAQGHYWLG